MSVTAVVNLGQTPQPGTWVLPLTIGLAVTVAAGKDTSALPIAVGNLVTPAVVEMAVFNGRDPIATLTTTQVDPVAATAVFQLSYPTVLVAPSGCPSTGVPLPFVGPAEQAAFAAALLAELNASSFTTSLVGLLNTYFQTTLVTGLRFTRASFGTPLIPVCV